MENTSECGGANMRKKLGIVLLVIIGAVGIYGIYAYAGLRNMMNEIHYETDTDNLRDEELSLRGQPFSVLLLGIDSDGPSDPGRSDSMMLVTINPNERSTIIFSIQRDTLVEMVGMGFNDKINHAFAFGGPEMSINSVQNWLDVPVDFFVELHQEGFQTLVDAVDGVTIDNDLVAFSFDGYDFPLGELRLTGSSALAFTRMRKQDPQGDFGRMARQRLVLEGLAHRGLQVGVTRFGPIMEAMGESMRTNFTLNELIGVATNYHRALDDVIMKDLRGQGTRINGIWYQVVSESDRQEASSTLRSHLELS